MRRREFLIAGAVVPFLAARQRPSTTPAGRPIRLGGPIFLKSDDPAELAREHRRWGYSAAYCPAATAADGDRVRAIRSAFAAEGVVIAEVGAWRNMLDPDVQKRADNLKYVTERWRSPSQLKHGAVSTSPVPTIRPSGTERIRRICRTNSSTRRSRIAGK